MIFKYYGLANLQTTLREMAQVGKDGTSLLTLARIAEAFGFSTGGYRLAFEQLSAIQLPCIAHYTGNHFVVIYKAEKDRVWIANPSYGTDVLSTREFLSKWKGVVLVLAPGERVFQGERVGEVVKKERESRRRILRRHYLALLRPFKKVIFEIFWISGVLQLLVLTLPFFTQGIVDRVLVYQDVKLLSTILLGMLAMFVIQVLLTYARNILVAQLKVNLELDFFSGLFDHFVHLEQAYFDGHRREDFINRFQENLRIRRILSPAIVQPFIDLIFVGNFVAALFFYDVGLASIVLTSVVLLLTITVLFTPRLRRLEDKMFYDNMETMTGFLDTLLGIQTVKLMGLEKLKLWEWKKTYTKALNRVLVTEQTYAKLQSLLKGCYFFSQIVVYWMGAQMALRGKLSVGQYIAFIAIFTSIMISLNSIFTLWSIVTELSISYARLNDIFVNKPEHVDIAENQPDIGTLENIELENVSFKYSRASDKYALRNVNLTITAGEHLAIVGRNGSGKSTLVKLLAKLYSNYSGNIHLNGIEARGISPDLVRKKIFMLPQDVYLFSGTIRENIACANPEASINEIIEAAKLARIHDDVCSFYLGYNHKISQEASSLSGGQKLKIAFARLFLTSADLIILDEASSALDIETEQAIFRNLKERFRNQAIISIAHRMNTVRNADRIIVLDAGSILEEGDHDTLMVRQGLYYQFVQSYLNT